MFQISIEEMDMLCDTFMKIDMTAYLQMLVQNDKFGKNDLDNDEKDAMESAEIFLLHMQCANVKALGNIIDRING